MNKFELEYDIQSSQKIVFERLSSASGLSEWFADDVHQRGNRFTFIWEGVEQEAEMTYKKENFVVRFNWLDQEKEDTYFEFRIEKDALTNDMALIITDFAEEEEMDEAMELWDSQINNLKHLLGA